MTILRKHTVEHAGSRTTITYYLDKKTSTQPIDNAKNVQNEVISISGR